MKLKSLFGNPFGALSIAFGAMVLATSCGSGVTQTPAPTCPALTGTPWTTSFAGATPANHNAAVSVASTVIPTTGPVVGFAQAAPASVEVTVPIDMTQDLGPSGSLTLEGQVVNYPSSLHGAAFAYLVSLNDGVNEYINLARTGTNGDCAASGYYNAAGTQINSKCVINSPSAFGDRDHWEQHQGFSDSASGSISTNVFPTCNWSDGTGIKACAFNSTFFPAGITPARLRYGVQYTAKYLIMADSYATVPAGTTAGLTVTVVKKTTASAVTSGAVDLNFIFVGSSNIQASRTPRGKMNLDSMVSIISGWFSASPTQVSLGKVQGIEWNCQAGGDTYATLGLSKLNNVFIASSKVAPAATTGKAMNIFFVGSIQDDSSGANPNLTILGVDGAIGGPTLQGTAVSGTVVSTFGQLGTFNPNCPLGAGVCNFNQIEKGFFDFCETVIHESGHYLGLNHLTERTGSPSNPVADDPICTALDSSLGDFLSINSCLRKDTTVFPGDNNTCNQDCTANGGYNSSAGQFCPAANACEFNYTMWWTVHNFNSSTGTSDGIRFSAEESTVMRYHPIVQ